jgi:sarcosine oxidase subunit beta
VPGFSGAGSAGGQIVIIGGGVIGLSLAYHLVTLGHAAVTVVERGLLGGGASSKGTGGIRTQFSSAVNVQLSLASVQFYKEFQDVVGAPFAFRQHGYLFALHDEGQLAQVRRNVQLQQSLGAHVEILARAELANLVPGLRTDDLVAGTYSPEDGSASPADAVNGFAAAARAGGANLIENTPVIGIEHRAEGSVTGVRTPDGLLEADAVVIAAGPWTAQVGALVDIDIPVHPHSRQAFEIGPLPELNPDLPFTIDLKTGGYLHPKAQGAVIGGGDRDTPASYEAKIDWDSAGEVFASLKKRVPWLSNASIRKGWAGLREMTPDDHGIVGPVLELPNLWVAAGFSGHGFMQAPAVGRELARALLGLPALLDITDLRYSRFAEGALLAENALF